MRCNTNGMPQRGRILGGLLLLLGLACCPAHTVFAQFQFNPYATLHAEYDSNVFRVPDVATLQNFNGATQMSDYDATATVGLKTDYLFGRQDLTTTLEYKRQTFDHYSDLSHNEYTADANLAWVLTHLLDGSLELRQKTSMAAFELGNSNKLTINTETYGGAKANINFAPDWKIETGLGYRRFKNPLQLYPDFVEKDVNSHLALDYIGVAHLTYGVAVDRIDGKLENAQNAGAFTQDTGSLTARYLLGKVTQLNAAAGYTRRTQDVINGGTVSAFTGALGYNRQLTGKTDVYVNLTRMVNTYAAAAGSEVDTTASVGADWQATYKFAMSIGYNYTKSHFIGQAIGNADVNGRSDHSQGGQINATYKILPTFNVRAFASKQRRTSTIHFYTFDDNIFGLEANWSYR